MTEPERKLIRLAARQRNESVSEFVRRVALDDAAATMWEERQQNGNEVD